MLNWEFRSAIYTRIGFVRDLPHSFYRCRKQMDNVLHSQNCPEGAGQWSPRHNWIRDSLATLLRYLTLNVQSAQEAGLEHRPDLRVSSARDADSYLEVHVAHPKADNDHQWCVGLLTQTNGRDKNEVSAFSPLIVIMFRHRLALNLSQQWSTLMVRGILRLSHGRDTTFKSIWTARIPGCVQSPLFLFPTCR